MGTLTVFVIFVLIGLSCAQESPNVNSAGPKNQQGVGSGVDGLDVVLDNLSPGETPAIVTDGFQTDGIVNDPFSSGQDTSISSSSSVGDPGLGPLGSSDRSQPQLPKAPIDRRESLPRDPREGVMDRRFGGSMMSPDRMGPGGMDGASRDTFGMMDRRFDRGGPGMRDPAGDRFDRRGSGMFGMDERRGRMPGMDRRDGFGMGMPPRFGFEGMGRMDDSRFGGGRFDRMRGPMMDRRDRMGGDRRRGVDSRRESMDSRDPMRGSTDPRDPMSGGMDPRDPMTGGMDPRDPMTGGMDPRDPMTGGMDPRDPMSGGLDPRDSTMRRGMDRRRDSMDVGPSDRRRDSGRRDGGMRDSRRDDRRRDPRMDRRPGDPFFVPMGDGPFMGGRPFGYRPMVPTGGSMMGGMNSSSMGRMFPDPRFDSSMMPGGVISDPRLSRFAYLGGMPSPYRGVMPSYGGMGTVYPGGYPMGMGSGMIGGPGMGSGMIGGPGMGSGMIGGPGMGGGVFDGPGMGARVYGGPGMGTGMMGYPVMGTMGMTPGFGGIPMSGGSGFMPGGSGGLASGGGGRGGGGRGGRGGGRDGGRGAAGPSSGRRDSGSGGF